MGLAAGASPVACPSPARRARQLKNRKTRSCTWRSQGVSSANAGLRDLLASRVMASHCGVTVALVFGAHASETTCKSVISGHWQVIRRESRNLRDWRLSRQWCNYDFTRHSRTVSKVKSSKCPKQFPSFPFLQTHRRASGPKEPAPMRNPLPSPPLLWTVRTSFVEFLPQSNPNNNTTYFADCISGRECFGPRRTCTHGGSISRSISTSIQLRGWLSQKRSNGLVLCAGCPARCCGGCPSKGFGS